RESRDRVRAALMSSKADWPLKRITVNLAPTGVPKVGAALDLPIAIGILVADGQIAAEAVAGKAWFGELGLDGKVRAIPGALALVSARRDHWVVVPSENYAEARLTTADVQAVENIDQVLAALQDG